MQNIKRKTFWVLAIIGLLFAFTSCSKSGSGEFGEMKISFANTNLEYVVGETFILNPSIQNGTAADSELEWSIFDESVVKLVNGEFVALKEGKTIIKVASVTKPSVNAMVSVKVVKNQYFPIVSFNVVDEIMNVDAKQMITATIEGTDFDAKVTYRSLDSNVATVNEFGVVEAFNTGATVIIVRITEVGDESNYEEYTFLIKVVEPEYSIEYELNGGNNHLENLDFYTKRQCPITLKDATREGYNFLGWFDEEDNLVTEISKYEESDIKLYAKWEPTKYNSYFANVEFEINKIYNDGYDALLKNSFANVQSWWSFIGINETGSDNLYVINEVGFNNPNEFYDGPKNSDKYITIHGDYRTENDEKHDEYYRLRSIIEDVNSIGKYVSLEVVDSEVTIATIFEKIESYTINEYVYPFVTPVRKGHDFLGWYSVDENGVESAEPVTMIETGTIGDRHFIAKWAPTQYEVKYNLNGGNGVAKDYYAYLYSDEIANAYQLQVPTKGGYNFLGWYEEADFSGDVVTEIAKGTLGNKEYFAKWEIINYTISYNVNGGTTLGENPTVYNAETPTIVLYGCEKEYYDFVGWEDQNGNVYNDIKLGSFGDLELIAKYEPKTYEIVYNLNGGVGETEGEYSYSETESYVINLVPTKDHYAFAAWYNNPEFTGSPVTEIAALTYGTINLYAKYNPVEYEFTFVDAGSIEPAINVINSTTNSTNFWANYTSHIFLIEGSKFTSSINAQWSDRFGIKYDSETAKYYISSIGYSGSKSFTYSGVDYVLMISESYGNYASTNAFTSGVSVGDYLRFIGDPATGITTIETYIPYSLTYTIEDNKALPTPIKDGYVFKGWYDNAELSGESIASIVAGTYGNNVLYGKWELQSYTITYNLNGGNMVKAYDSYAEVVAEFLNDYNTARGKTYTIETFSALGSMSEISGASLFLYNATYRAKWAWLVDYIATVAGSANKKAYQNFNNYNSQAELNSANSNYIYSIAYELRGFVGGIKYSKNANFVTGDYSAESVKSGIWSYIPPKTYNVLTNDIVLKEPTKDDMMFAGWYDNAEFAGDPIKVIKKGSSGDVQLYAKWESDRITVNGVTYGSVTAALEAANAGDTILIKSGTYNEEVTITKQVIIKGANADVNPVTSARSDETVFTANVNIKADGVVINGIKLTGNARIKGTDSGFNGLTVKNVVIADSTVNSGGSNTDAPFYFYTTTAKEFKNIVIENVKLSGGTGRPMAMYGSQINGLTIKNSSFVAVRSSYNDGFKIAQGGSFGIKGDVVITGNHIENFAQYVLWFAGYAEGTYKISNNTFYNCGQTAANHAAAYFAAYVGSATGCVNIDFSYNKVDKAYSLIRISDTSNKSNSNHTVKCNYNKLYNCSATYYVNNQESDITVDARFNYYANGVSASKFLNATYSDYYSNESDVPTYTGE